MKMHIAAAGFLIALQLSIPTVASGQQVGAPEMRGPRASAVSPDRFPDPERAAPSFSRPEVRPEAHLSLPASAPRGVVVISDDPAERWAWIGAGVGAFIVGTIAYGIYH